MSREKSFLEKPQRRPEKQKKPLGEGTEDSRFAKISFKRYLREIEEEDSDDLDGLDFSSEELYHLAEGFIERNRYSGMPSEDVLQADGREYFELMGVSSNQLDEAISILANLIGQEYE